MTQAVIQHMVSIGERIGLKLDWLSEPLEEGPVSTAGKITMSHT